MEHSLSPRRDEGIVFQMQWIRKAGGEGVRG